MTKTNMPDRFTNLVRNHLVLLAVLINAGIVLVVACALILPMRASIAAQKTWLATLRQDFEIKQQRVQFDEKNQKGLAAVAGTDLQKLDALFVEGSTSPSIFASLEALAQGAHFTPTSIDIAQARTEGDRSGNLQVAVQLQGGSYFELKELVGAILHSAPLLDISSLTFAGENAGITLNLKAYALGQGSASAASVIDFALFNDPRFKALRVSIAPFEQGTVGRSNPFSPPSP